MIYLCNANYFMGEGYVGPCGRPAQWFRAASPSDLACDRCREGLVKGLDAEYLPIALMPMPKRSEP